MSLAKQEFTNAGRAMLGRAQNGETLTITKIVVGSGTAASEEDLWPLTALIAHELDVTLSTKRDYGDGTLLVEGSFNSDEAPQAFFLKEVGVMAHIAAEADRLYSVSNVLLDAPDYIDPAVPTIQAFKIKLVIDRIPTANLVVEISPSENVVGENIGADTVGPGPYHEAAGNVLYFKRFVEGPGIELTEAVDEHSIEIAVKQLRVNVDLYVPENHPDAPNPDVAFPTIQAAHDYLKAFRIPADKVATIHVYKGTLIVNTPTLFDHPDSIQIAVVGYARTDKSVSSITFINETPGRKRLAIASITDLENGTRGYLANCVTPWSGGCQIMAVPQVNNVLVSIEKRDTRGNWTTTESGGTIRFSFFQTVIDGRTIAAGTNPVFSCPYGIRKFENLCVVGAWAAFSLHDGEIKNCQGWGNTRGINNAGGNVSISGECCFTQCDFGITGPGTVTAYEGVSSPMTLFINACTHGIYPSGSGYAIGTITTGMDNTRVYLARNTYAVNCSVGASMIGGSFLYAFNNKGFSASANATIVLGSAYGSQPVQNGVDLYAQGNSYIQYDRHGETVPVCDPPAGVPGNDEAYIKVLNTTS